MFEALAWIVGTSAAMSGLLWFTDSLDRRSSVRLIRQVASKPGHSELSELLVAQECERLLKRSA